MRKVTLLVTVGTDFHAFDRLLDWTDEWLSEQPEIALNTLIQYGSSRPPLRGNGALQIPYGELQGAMAQASLAVSHGGPATLLEIRRHGHLPICVPRDPDRGEHVDRHQLRFARHLAEAGVVVLCEDKDSYFQALNQGLANPKRVGSEGDVFLPPPGVSGLSDAVNDVFRAHRQAKLWPATLKDKARQMLGGM